MTGLSPGSTCGNNRSHGNNADPDLATGLWFPAEARPRMTNPTGTTVTSPARALFHTAPRRVDIREVPAPRPAAGEVLVRTLCSGISGGTERLVYRGEVPADLALDDTIGALGGTFSYPFAYGYACVGEVADSGQAVFAFHPHQDVFAARADDLIPLPAIDPASATLFPLVETALQVTLDAGTGYRDRVIVLSAGVLGLLTSLLLQRSGWRPLLAEPQSWRRALASSLGATAAVPEELAEEKVPLVIDASGNPDAPAMALNMLAHEGTLLIASWFGAKPVVLPLGGAFHRRRLIIRSTQVSTVPAGCPRPGRGRGAAGRPLSCWPNYRWHSCALTSSHSATQPRRSEPWTRGYQG